MEEPTKEQVKEFWERCGFQIHLDKVLVTQGDWAIKDGVITKIPDIDLNNLFKYLPEVVVGICFRFYPGGCECEITYITEAGFDTAKSWVENKSGIENESKKLANIAVFWAIWEVIHD